MSKLQPRTYLIAFGGALTVALLFLLWAYLATPFGFPLDDAWIHQVFARNLFLHGEFSYNPGELASGSTAPLWTLLLVPSYLFNDTYMIWAYLLGIACLALTALEVYRVYGLLFGKGQDFAALVALIFTVFEWRLGWASVSGMETLLFAWLSMLVLRLSLSNAPVFWTGLAGGLLTLTRPEGIVLAGLVGLEAGRRIFANRSVQGKPLIVLSKTWGLMGLGLLLPLLPYALFNYSVSGSVLPNTFSAKTAFYTSDHNLLNALAYLLNAVVEICLRGGAIALFPGFVWLIARRSVRFNWLPLVWASALLLLYAWRLPVVYHHARYLMPLIPIFILYGVKGSGQLLQALRDSRFFRLARLLPGLAALLVFISLLTGAETYRFDVKYINDEQVRVGKWLHDNTPTGAIVATHDIGAIGYFSGRRIVDTAGLVTPAYIPIVLNQSEILKRVRADGVNYFAMLPTWYPSLNDLLELEGRKVFQPQETYLEKFDQKNMAVFKLKD
ncbi:MAG: hypothetical protein HXX08_13145 [Chloroflexi bacterium]|uniref:Glycosyltransferase RgtA/B/C/D-like domain-containing protein n=1 Tax=Candidatus Chlorohelix allophototropha TaxID=3003348 RepID=A0A8T7M420_9CHLR|nr:hypothetical protein [Chloroflexota bacterium]WJW70199.1 hypothetical protein OZ401_004716 [Chloroflexota bacterium L227-S17]